MVHSAHFEDTSTPFTSTEGSTGHDAHILACRGQRPFQHLLIADYFVGRQETSTRV